MSKPLYLSCSGSRPSNSEDTLSRSSRRRRSKSANTSTETNNSNNIISPEINIDNIVNVEKSKLVPLQGTTDDIQQKYSQKS